MRNPCCRSERVTTYKMNAISYFLIIVNTFFVLSLDIEVNEIIADDTIVETTTGLVKGEIFNDNWYRFRSIPFAEPPVGALRFEVSVLAIIHIR